MDNQQGLETIALNSHLNFLSQKLIRAKQSLQRGLSEFNLRQKFKRQPQCSLNKICWPDQAQSIQDHLNKFTDIEDK